MSFKTYIKARFKEPSSWAGAAAMILAVSMGLPADPTQVALIASAITGIIGVFLPENKPKT